MFTYYYIYYIDCRPVWQHMSIRRHWRPRTDIVLVLASKALQAVEVAYRRSSASW